MTAAHVLKGDATAHPPPTALPLTTLEIAINSMGGHVCALLKYHIRDVILSNSVNNITLYHHIIMSVLLH